MSRRAERGLSLVELMVGIAVGLTVVAAASTLMAAQMKDARRLQTETQVEQDLRAAADLVARDLRRAGYWQHATLAAADAHAAPNPYGNIATTDAGEGRSTIAYVRSQDDAGAENDAVDPNERSGVKLEGGTLKLLLGDAGWQSITDPDVVTVNRFRVALDTRPVPLTDYCSQPCPPMPAAPCPPVQEVREAHIELAGQAAHDAAVQRSLQLTVRIRNDLVSGHCGA
jgi:type IV pilus assembly protein PilW